MPSVYWFMCGAIITEHGVMHLIKLRRYPFTTDANECVFLNNNVTHYSVASHVRKLFISRDLLTLYTVRVHIGIFHFINSYKRVYSPLMCHRERTVRKEHDNGISLVGGTNGKRNLKYLSLFYRMLLFHQVKLL